MSFDGLDPFLDSNWEAAQYVDFSGLADLTDGSGFTDLLAQHEMALRTQFRAFYQRQWEEALAAETRRHWSGPDRWQRRALKAYRLSAADIGLMPRSFLGGAYRRRQRARVKRRRQRPGGRSALGAAC